MVVFVESKVRKIYNEFRTWCVIKVANGLWPLVVVVGVVKIICEHRTLVSRHSIHNTCIEFSYPRTQESVNRWYISYKQNINDIVSKIVQCACSNGKKKGEKHGKKFFRVFASLG